MKVVLAIIVALTARAVADDRADADRLFAEGRALIEAGKPDTACLKFRESFAKDRHAIGTLLNLGLCNERQGKIATAVVLYREAVDRAIDAKLDSSRDAAQERLAILTPLLPQVAITVAEAAPDQKLLVDDAIVAPGALTLDPGVHDVMLTAPERLPYRTTVRAELGKHTAIELPALRRESARRFVGKIGVASGGGLVVLSTVLFLVAKHDYDAPFDAGNCKRVDLTCNASGQRDVDAARHLGTAGSVVGIVGIAALAGGAALWLTAPGEGTAIVPTGNGLAVAGRF